MSQLRLFLQWKERMCRKTGHFYSSTKNVYISSIRFISHPANWMMILCNVVPWRKTSILGAAA